MRKLRTMDDVPLDGKRVLTRVDFNVSVGADGRVDSNEDYRIEAALPTIEELMQRRCRVMLLTHHEEADKAVAADDLVPIHRRLQDLLREEVRLLKHLYGSEVEAALAGLEPGSVVLLPNVRGDQRETHPSDKFAQELIQHADLYINEAFSVCHRDHTSVVLPPKMLPSAAGRRTVIEVEALGRLIDAPARPYVAIVSGVKIDTKINLLRQLLEHVDKVCLGGRIANVILAAQGNFPAAHFTAEELTSAQQLLQLAQNKLVLPPDVVVGPPDASDGIQTISIHEISPAMTGIWDIGPLATEQIISACAAAKSIMWNGPLGKFEVPAYAAATRKVAENLADSAAYRVAGGGDTLNALEQFRLIGRFDHVSVGGGAMIAFLEGKQLPGLEPLYHS